MRDTTLLGGFHSAVSAWKSKANLIAVPVAVDPSAGPFWWATASLVGREDVNARQREIVQILEAYGFLEYFIWLEQSLVPPTCAALRALPLPRYLTEVLLSIEVQEQNHSTWAYELELGIEEATGIRRPDLMPDALNGIAEAVNSIPDELQALAVAFALVVAEVLDFGTAAKISDDESLNPGIRAFAGRHEVEERLHRVYFRNVLVDLWRVLSEEQRRQLTAITPRVAEAFVTPDVKRLGQAFSEAEISGFESRQILDNPELRVQVLESVALVEGLCAGVS